METEEVCHEGEDEAEADVDGRDEGGEEVVVETDDRLPVEDVEVLDELPDRHLGDHDDERHSADEHGRVADGHRQWREAVVDEVGDPSGQADDHLHPAQVGQELVDQGDHQLARGYLGASRGGNVVMCVEVGWGHAGWRARH